MTCAEQSVPVRAPKRGRATRRRSWGAGRRLPIVALALLASACSSASPQDQVEWQGPFGERPAEQVYVLRPEGPVRSVVVFGHGWSDYTPAKYKPWFKHLAQNGNAIIYPRYQATDSLSELHQGAQMRQAWLRGLRSGFIQIGQRDLPVVAVGYSAGAALVYNYASQAQTRGLPVPKAVDLIFPGATLDLVPGIGRPLPFPTGTRILLQVGDRDAVVGPYDADAIWKSLRNVPSVDKEYEIVHSAGAFVAHHLAPQGTSKPAQRAFWVPLDALIASARGSASTLAALLPTKLSTEPEPLRKETFPGPIFVKARFQLASPVTVDFRTFLKLLDRRPSDLAVAWALSNYEGHIKAFAFRVTGTRAPQLVDAYLKASTRKIRVERKTIAGKHVTAVSVGVPIHGYLYAWHDVLFMTVETGLRPGELRDILSALP